MLGEGVTDASSAAEESITMHNLLNSKNAIEIASCVYTFSDVGVSQNRSVHAPD